MKSFIEFKCKTESGKTSIWTVRSNVLLGHIRWHPGWRRYAFFPEPNTLFEEDCLTEIAEAVGGRNRFP